MPNLWALGDRYLEKSFSKTVKGTQKKHLFNFLILGPDSRPKHLCNDVAHDLVTRHGNCTHHSVS